MTVAMNKCPNTTDDDAECVDTNCTYCKIARAESPKPKED